MPLHIMYAHSVCLCHWGIFFVFASFFFFFLWENSNSVLSVYSIVTFYQVLRNCAENFRECIRKKKCPLNSLAMIPKKNDVLTHTGTNIENWTSNSSIENALQLNPPTPIFVCVCVLLFVMRVVSFHFISFVVAIFFIRFLGLSVCHLLRKKKVKIYTKVLIEKWNWTKKFAI